MTALSMHTPGPWKVLPEAVTRAVEMFEIAEVSHLRVVCDGRGDGFTAAGDAEADARLIAAAPTLLEALQSLATYTSEFGDSGTDFADQIEGARLLRNARAAIAKATGAQP
jgi:hypothetical protein